MRRNASTDCRVGESVKLHNDGPIVLVEDDYADAWLWRRCYEMSALSNEFIWLGSGLALIEYLRAVGNGSAAMPALIMLDLHMRELTGVQTLRLIESIANRAPPEILVFTDSRSALFLEEASRLGATAYYAKSPDPAETIEYFNSLAA